MYRRILLSLLFLVAVPFSYGAPFQTGIHFALAEKAPAGTHYWCAFPEFPAQWVVVLYERERHAFGPSTYTPLATVMKPKGAHHRMLTQMMTVPHHNGRECFLVAYRNGVQQPYRGFTDFNPFGWHTFGVEPPIQALISEFPPNTPVQDIANYETALIRQWSMPPHG